MTRKEATETLAREAVTLVLQMLAYPTCPIRDSGEQTEVGGNALISAFVSFMVHRGASIKDAAIVLRAAADHLDRRGAGDALTAEALRADLTALRDAVRAYLAVDGSEGTWNAVEAYAARARLRALLGGAP